jgi:hypothetical protein
MYLLMESVCSVEMGRLRKESRVMMELKEGVGTIALVLVRTISVTREALPCASVRKAMSL